MQRTLTLLKRYLFDALAHVLLIQHSIECTTNGTVSQKREKTKNGFSLNSRAPISMLNYINRDATFRGKMNVLLPSKIARVCCRADGMLSKTGRPRRVTSSRNNCWFRFRSMYSLQVNAVKGFNHSLINSSRSDLLWRNGLIENALLSFIRMQHQN